MMKRIYMVLFALLVNTYANAQGINFMDNPKWETVLEKAKKENKIIFLDAYATWCGPCKQMESDVYVKKEVADFYNANFVNVKIDMEKGEGAMLADRYYVNAYPNLVFINPDGAMIHKAVGFRAAEDFVSLGKEAKNPETQYYTLKKKALELSNAQFLVFAEKAMEFEDDDLFEIGESYLAKQPDILANADLINLVMKYLPTLGDEKNLKYFADNKSRILREGIYTEADFESRLVDLTLQYAMSSKVQFSDDLDFDIVKNLLDKYVPQSSFFIYNYFRAQYFLGNKEVAPAMDAVNQILNNPSKSTYAQICNAVMALGPVFFENGKLDETFKKLDEIPVPENEKDLAYLKDFTKAVVYNKTQQQDKFKMVADNILKNDKTPKDVKFIIEQYLNKK